MNRFFNYLRDTKAEMKHVSWPTKTQTLVYTALVILISAVTAAFLGMFDYFFTNLLNIVV